ncbi:MAG TPA: LptF/LptG family permease, partial [Candidatus Acetothermia bacterium]|nr:LptF/LptG family permease [Candidatus Acetothermia bacterium]
SEAAYRRELLTILYQGEVPRPEEDLFFRGSEGELYYLSRYQGDRAWGIVVYDLEGKLFGEPGPFPVVVTASEGRFSSGELVLSSGRLLRFSPDGGLEEVLRFQSLTLQVGEEIQQGILGGKTPGEMSVGELLARIRLFTKSGLNPRNLVVELHSKLAIAAAALVFALFGAPLGALLGRRGRAAGAVAGFLLVAGAQGLFVWTRTLARRGFIPASLGGWLPHLMLGSLGLVLLLSVDRLRLKRLWLGLFLLGASLWGLGAPPPFDWLEAQQLVILREAEGFLAQEVAAQLGGYRLTAAQLEANWNGTSWQVEVQEAGLSGEGVELVAQTLEMELGAEGELLRLSAHAFSGSSRFQGPEKEETLVFRGRWGEASFQAGELERLSGEGVHFTTCPCLAGAPYAVEAGRFVLLPERWLYAEDVWIRAFGQPVGWLPVYAARLGEEASPLFPEIGQRGGHWYLRWHIPFTVGEGMWGAVGLTWFPGLGLVQPSLRFLWEEGRLDLAEGRGSLSASGEWPSGPWQARLSWRGNRVDLHLSGSLTGTNWRLTWGQTTQDDLSYQKLPELSVSRGGIPWLAGDLAWELRWGRYREGEET